jgi:lysophospholipase L1-like esterase
VNRREFLVSAAAAAAAVVTSSAFSAVAATRPATSPASSDEIPADVVWHDVRDWGVEGRGFDDTESYFDRLPARAKSLVRPAVWNLSRDSSGMSVRFETDSDGVYARYELRKPDVAMPHMPATGVSGVDLYGRADTGWRWLGVTRPREQRVVATLAKEITPGRRAYLAYLPLYNGLKSLEIGVRKPGGFWPTPPRTDKPILFYGTSITQGGCASRPGMSFVNLLGRRLDRPVLNFGFSGNGRLEIEVGRLLAELDPSIFVIDCIANATPPQIAERTVPLIKLLREKHPKTPILLLDQRRWDNEPLQPSLASLRREKSDVLNRAYQSLVDGGIEDVHLRGGADLLGTDGEATVDGSHPSDLGMMRYADALEGDLRKLLS